MSNTLETNAGGPPPETITPRATFDAAYDSASATGRSIVGRRARGVNARHVRYAGNFRQKSSAPFMAGEHAAQLVITLNILGQLNGNEAGVEAIGCALKTSRALRFFPRATYLTLAMQDLHGDIAEAKGNVALITLASRQFRRNLALNTIHRYMVDPVQAAWWLFRCGVMILLRELAAKLWDVFF
jgi:hypothetical protein